MSEWMWRINTFPAAVYVLLLAVMAGYWLLRALGIGRWLGLEGLDRYACQLRNESLYALLAGAGLEFVRLDVALTLGLLAGGLGSLLLAVPLPVAQGLLPILVWALLSLMSMLATLVLGLYGAGWLATRWQRLLRLF